jgi:hypothetical protein
MQGKARLRTRSDPLLIRPSCLQCLNLWIGIDPIWLRLMVDIIEQ